MSKAVVLGGCYKIDPNCEEINMCVHRVSDSEVVALGKQMAQGAFGRLKKLNLVSRTLFGLRANC